MARPLLLVTGIAEGLGAEIATAFVRGGLAREFGPRGVHVAHLVVDGLINEVQTEQRFGRSAAPRMPPRAIAKARLDLTAQHPSAWTHEMDLRPFSERS